MVARCWIEKWGKAQGVLLPALLSLALLTFGVGSLLVGTVLCIAGILVASLVSAH